MYGENNTEIYITVCKTDSLGEFAIWLRELKLGLDNNLEEWDVKGGRRDIQVGEDMGKPMADSRWCLVEINTIL